MSSKKPKSLYHYCSLETFISIIRNSSIWLSDVKKSNDSKELIWLRQHYYNYILDKYCHTDDADIKSICEIILSLSPQDGLKICPSWLLPSSGETAKQILDIFNSFRVFTFCLSQHADSLGQWRGYTDAGQGIAIGFSRKYLEAISGHGLSCPLFNFMLADVSYKTEFKSLFDSVFSLHDKTNISEFVFYNLLDITHISALFKHPSFKDEKEWRIIYSMSDCDLDKNRLHFEDFDLIASDKYKNNFSTPKIDYIVNDAKIIPHLEIKLKNISEAIDCIVIGPKCNATENDIRHMLINFGLLNDMKDTRIKVVRSESTYQ